ncbi:hypothetical protein VTH06DRAFT_3985 [Thermothelomyces fergusii]
MSDLFEAIKDAVNPRRRAQATVATYDPHTRGPYPDRAPAGTSQAQVQPTAAHHHDHDHHPQGAGGAAAAAAAAVGGDEARDEGPSGRAPPRRASGAGYDGPHKAPAANARDARVDPGRDGTPSHGLGDYDGAAAKPLHAEGSKYAAWWSDGREKDPSGGAPLLSPGFAAMSMRASNNIPPLVNATLNRDAIATTTMEGARQQADG